jgi:hypothetical protein
MLSGCDMTPESGEARKLAAEEKRKLAARNAPVEDQSGSAVGERSRCQ